MQKEVVSVRHNMLFGNTARALAILFFLGGIAVQWVGAAYFIKFDQTETESHAIERVSSLSMAFNEHVLFTFDFLRHILINVGEVEARLGSRGLPFDLFDDIPNIQGAILRIEVIGPDGKVAASNDPTSDRNRYYYDEEYFRKAKVNDVWVSVTTREPTSGKHVIKVAMKYERKDGSLAGVGVITFDTQHFAGYFRKLKIGATDTIALLRDDFKVLLRANGKGETSVGDTEGGIEIRRAAANAVSGTYQAASDLDGIVRIYGMQSLVRYPLIETVGLSRDEVFSEFNIRRNSVLGAVSASTLLLLVICGWVLQQNRREQQFADELQATMAEISAARSDLERQGEELAASIERQYWLNEQLKTEVAERKAAEEKMRHMAQHDALTGLPNRRLFFELAENALAMAKRSEYFMAVLNIDIDGFKGINDTLGHDEGDELLRQIGQRYAGRLRDSDVIARVGGDEFAAMLPLIASSKDAESVAEDIVALTSTPFQLKTGVGKVGASVGIAIFPKNGTTVEELMHQADEAMYRAKKSGKNQFRFAAPGGQD